MGTWDRGPSRNPGWICGSRVQTGRSSRAVCIFVSSYTPPKINMEPGNDGFQYQ